jgi:CBS-domain-containing membrane protein
MKDIFISLVDGRVFLGTLVGAFVTVLTGEILRVALKIRLLVAPAAGGAYIAFYVCALCRHGNR